MPSQHTIPITAATLFAVFCLSATAPAQFVLLEDFEDVTLGADLRDPNAGESFARTDPVSVARVTVVSGNPSISGAGGGTYYGNDSSRVADVRGIGVGLFMNIAPFATNNRTSTLFYQIYRSVGIQANLSIGLSETTTPADATGFAAFNSQNNVAEGGTSVNPQNFRPRDGTGFDQTGQSFVEGGWVNIWQVIDNGDAANPQVNETTRFYIQRPIDVAPLLLASTSATGSNPAIGQTDLIFRNLTAGDLVTFLIRTGGTSGPMDVNNDQFFFDNIFIDPNGVNLINPVPEPSTLGMLTMGALVLGAWRRMRVTRK